MSSAIKTEFKVTISPDEINSKENIHNLAIALYLKTILNQ